MRYNPSTMPTDFSQLITDIEWEARGEGAHAAQELERFREEFSLASQLISSRRQHNLTQRELSKLSGVPQSEISRIETGASNPTYATITALLKPLRKRVQLIDDRFAPSSAPVARAEPLPALAKPSRSRSSETAANATSVRPVGPGRGRRTP